MKIKESKQLAIFSFSIIQNERINFSMLGVILRLKYPPVCCAHIPKPESLSCIT